MVKASEGITYAEVLKKVKSQECFQEVEVTAARKTAAGFLLLQFAKATEQDKIDKVRDDIAKAMGSTANVRKLNRKKTIQIMDIEQLTTCEELQEMLQQVLAGCEYQLVSMRQGF